MRRKPMRIVFLVGLLSLPPPALATGAIASGPCDADGYNFGYYMDAPSRNEASARAIQQCGEVETTDRVHVCKVIVRVTGSCLAFAADKAQICGPTGSAYAPSAGRAGSLAVDACRENGGRNCVVKVARCDGGNSGTAGTSPQYDVPTIRLNPACG